MGHDVKSGKKKRESQGQNPQVIEPSTKLILDVTKPSHTSSQGFLLLCAKYEENGPRETRVVQYSDKFMHSIVLYYIHITMD